MISGAGSLQGDSGGKRMKGKGKPKMMKGRGQSMMAGKMEPGAKMPGMMKKKPGRKK